MNINEKNRGNYFGTVIDNKWWKRYTKDGFFARGSGEYWFDDKGLYFRKFLTKRPIYIPFSLTTGIELVKWHAGKWALGYDIIKLNWKRETLNLSSGICISKEKEKTLSLKKALEERINP